MPLLSSSRDAILRILALSVCVTSIACGGAVPAGRTGPSMGVEAWRSVESPHFTLQTDLEQAEAKELAVALEKIYLILHGIAFPLEKDPDLHTRVILFREKDDYALFGSKGSKGEFSADGFGALEGPTFMASTAFRGSMQETLVHELTHRFLHYLCPQAPRWLDEGLAEYYRTIEVDNGQATLGKSHYVFALGGEWRLYSNGIPVEALPSVGELERMDGRGFYAAREAAPGDAGEDARRKQTANYASAWATVHALLNGSKEAREAFQRWISSMAAGKAAAAAFEQAFGAGGISALDRERRALVEKVANGQIRLLYQDFNEAALMHFEERALRPAEVHVLWGSLQMGNGKEGEAGARGFVEEALRAEPTLTAARLLKATLLEREEHFTEAEREISAAASAAPDDEPAARALFVARAMPWKYGGETPETRAKAEALLASWLPRARQAHTLNLFARYQTTRGRTEEAVSIATRAATVDPTCVRCFATLGAALFRAGQFGAALDAQERGVALLGERRDWGDMVERLDLYRRASVAIQRWKEGAAGQSPGDLPADVTIAVQRAQTSHLRECYEHGLARNPKLAGAVTFLVSVGPDGKVGSVRERQPRDGEADKGAPQPPLADKDVVQCLTEQIGMFRFPESGGGIRFVVPIAFTPRS